MTQEGYITVEFAGELQAIKRLRSENSVFDEICKDLDLLSRDLATFSEEESLGKQGAYSDVLESIQALHQELVVFLKREGSPVARDL